MTFHFFVVAFDSSLRWSPSPYQNGNNKKKEMSPLPSPPIEIREDQPSFDSSLLFFLISIYFHDTSCGPLMATERMGKRSFICRIRKMCIDAVNDIADNKSRLGLGTPLDTWFSAPRLPRAPTRNTFVTRRNYRPYRNLEPLRDLSGREDSYPRIFFPFFHSPPPPRVLTNRSPKISVIRDSLPRIQDGFIQIIYLSKFL